MPTLEFFNKHGIKIPAGSGEFHVGRSIRLGLPVNSAHDGLPSYVHSITVKCDVHVATSDRFGNLDFSCTPLSYPTLITLLENTPRKLGEIQMSSSDPVRLSQNYLELLALICTKAERLEFRFSALSHTAEMDCLATGLTQSNGPAELHVDLSCLDTPEKKPALQKFFRSIAASSLDKLEIFHICDLSEDNLGDLLINALKANRTIKTLKIRADWGREPHMVEKVMCAILEQAQVEDLRIFSTAFGSSEIKNNSSYEMMTSTFFEKLATARNLKSLELSRNLLPESDSYLTSFEDVIARNTCLERLHMWFNCGDVRKKAWEMRCNEKLWVPLCVNRAVRGLSHSTATAGLWPHVLERAGKILYYSAEFRREENWKKPSSEGPRADVLYKLLRERVLLA